MNKPAGFSDSVADEIETPAQCAKCGATTRLEEGTCINCLLREGLEAEGEASRAAFESVLAEADVPDKEWRLGQYEVLEEIGRGGMGVIYRARQRHSRRIVALKRVLAYQADSHETLARFRREAAAAAKLDHPNILPIYEVSESEDGLPFFSMKYATGGSLRTAAPALRAEPRECVRLLAKVARAVDYAHGQGILHRDLQPGNILLDGRGEPLVSDFGLAKWLTENSDLTQTLTTFGTPGYIAPEQAESAAGDLTPATDVYSLGAILFNLLARRPPFVGANVLSVIRQAAAGPAPRLRSFARSLDRDLETITARCLERDPQARYQSAADLAEDLERWLEGRPILARPVYAPARLWRWARRNPVLAGASIACLLLGATVLWLLPNHAGRQPEFAASEKSIAVLPFQNLSAEKENAFFAAGFQDDLLTSLGKIKELKVIGRASVRAYPEAAAAGKLHEIGKTLRVSHVVEGSVRRSAKDIVINVALLDTRDDRQVWSERYQRTLSDTLTLQGQLAIEIARALQAHLTLEERADLAIRPTDNPDAYVLYLRARELEVRFKPSEEDRETAIKLYQQAVDLDPRFALARARHSIAISLLTQGEDPGRKAKAQAEAEEALRLRPGLGEARLATAYSYLWWDKDFDRALRELSRVAEVMPSSAEVPWTAALIYKQQNKFRDRIAALKRALILDPRDTNGLNRLYLTFRWVRNWPEALRTRDEVRTLLPNEPGFWFNWGRAWDEFRMTGNIDSLKKSVAKAPPNASQEELALMRYQVATLERDYPAAERFLAGVTPKVLESFYWKHPKSVEEALLSVARGASRATVERGIESARQEIERILALPPLPSTRVDELHSNLGLLYAFLGRKEDALREGRRGLELVNGAMEKNDASAALALMYARLGEADEAITLIEHLLTVPSELHPSQMHAMTLADLKWRWQWDPLRNDPRFQKILAGPEPTTIY